METRSGDSVGSGERVDRVLLDGTDELVVLVELLAVLSPTFVRTLAGVLEHACGVAKHLVLASTLPLHVSYVAMSVSSS